MVDSDNSSSATIDVASHAPAARADTPESDATLPGVSTNGATAAQVAQRMIAPDSRVMLSRDEIIATRLTLPYEIVPTDEWRLGSAVRVVKLMAVARDILEQKLLEMRESKDHKNIRALFAALCIVDEQNLPMFTVEDVTALGMLDATPIDRIFEAAQRLNDVSDKAVERAAGNSEREGSDTSSSPSL